MNQLWIVNKCCGDLHYHLFSKKSTGGLWLDSMIEQVHLHPEDRITIVNVEKIPRLNNYTSDNISYYTIAGNPSSEFNWKDHKIIEQWDNIIEKEKPDVILLWGTEFPYYLSIPSKYSIPAIVFIQGILNSIGKYYTAGLRLDEIRKAVSFKDIVLRSTILGNQKKYLGYRSEYERQIINRANNVIVENKWAISYCKKISNHLNTYMMPISISQEFQDAKWSIDKMEAYSIMCPAADYPIKGLHMLLRAVDIVKKRYPNVKLYVPGSVLRKTSSIKERKFQTGYEKLITQMIHSLDLKDNIVYTGRLTGEEMAKLMSSVNCFTMTSAIENHSSTLKEAMAVGTPCIASYVGGVPEYAVNNFNSLLYRFEDYEMLAQCIIELFSNRELCVSLSDHCKQYTAEKTNNESDYLKLRKILIQVIQNQRY